MSYKFKPYSCLKANDKTRLWFDNRPLFAFGCNIMIVIGARGIGKTFSFKRYCMNRFFDKGYMFAWLRDSDIARRQLSSNNGAKFFDDVGKMKLHTEKFVGRIDGETIRLNGKTAGYLMPSNTFQNYKGNDFDSINTIVYDEFIAERGTSYRGSRSWEIINMLYTIARNKKDIKIILLANALERGDELLQTFGLNIKDDSKGIYVDRSKGIACYYCDNSPSFEEERRNSVMGKAIKGTQFEDNLFHNNFGDDTLQYYGKRPPYCKLHIILCDKISSVRLYDAPDGFIYACNDFNPNTQVNMRYTTDFGAVDSHRALLSKYARDTLVQAFSNNQVRFDSANTKNAFVRIISSLRKK